MTTWAPHPVRHPWFDLPNNKRKPHFTPAVDTQDSTPSPPMKRRKHSNLEHGFARLSLSNVSEQTEPSSPSVLYTRLSNVSAQEVSYPDDSWTVQNGFPPAPVLPASVEEPHSPSQNVPEIPEVKMKGSSWYEPEKDRIVVTDLDDSEDEGLEEANNSELTVSQTLLNRLKASPGLAVNFPKDSLGRPPSDSSLALVLFKPHSGIDFLHVSETQENGDAEDAKVDARTIPSKEALIDDAMDTDP